MPIVLSVFLMKFADCALSTLKTVFLVREKFFVSSVLNSLSAALFIFVADAMANSTDEMKILIAGAVFIANLMGGYIPPKLVRSFEEDKLFVYVITAPTFDEGIKFSDLLGEMKIPHTTTVSYTERAGEIEKVLTVKAYAGTKDESREVHSLLKPGFKYHVIETL